MSAYEVQSVVAGESFVAQDLILGGEPVRVSERTATRVLQPGQRIAARIVELSGQYVMAGGMLPFDAASADALLEELNGDLAAFREGIEEQRVALAEAELKPDEEAMLVQFWLHGVAPLFTVVWLEHVLSRTAGAPAGLPAGARGGSA